MDVIIQYKLENIGYNQCSWFCIELLTELKNNNWQIDEHTIVEIYNRCLTNATLKRKEFGKLSWGESLFSDTIHKINKYELYITEIAKCIVNMNSSTVNKIYIPEMQDIQTYKDNLKSITVGSICKNIRYLYGDKKYIMINRFGESFIIFPKDVDSYYIFDSHKSKIDILSYSETIRYVNLQTDVYNFIIYVDGFQSELKMHKHTIDLLYHEPDSML